MITNVAFGQVATLLLVTLGDVNCPLMDAPEKLTTHSTLVTQLLIEKSLLVTVPEEKIEKNNVVLSMISYLKCRLIPFLELVTEGHSGHRNVVPDVS